MSETTPATCPDPAHSKQAAQQTALREEHARLGASFTTFGGWEMPLKYHNELIEHRAVRGAAGLFDLSHMGQIWVQGPQAGAFLDYALVSNLSTIPAGKAKYSLMCSPSGGIIDDLICYRHPSAVGDESYLVVPNAANTAIVYAEFLDRSQGFEVSLTDASTTTSLIALQGPKSVHILLSLVPAEQSEAVLGLKYYAATEVTVAGVPVLLARTGYTGEDGFELYLAHSGTSSPEEAIRLWQALLAADPVVVPCGLAARDSLRLEAAMPLYGQELSREVNPFEAGLGTVVSMAPSKTAKAGDFVGKAALERIKAERAGSLEGQRVLVGLRGEGRRAARAHYPVLDDSEQRVGEVTSGLPSPTLGYPIALAYVGFAQAKPGTRLTVNLRGKAEPFTVVELPFYRRSR